MLDQRPDHLQSYLANAVYEACRAGKLSLSGFPNYDTYLAALREGRTESNGREYQVCVRRGGNLIVLAAYANKWLDCEQFKAETNELIQTHNKTFNPDGDFMEEPETRTGLIQGC